MSIPVGSAITAVIMAIAALFFFNASRTAKIKKDAMEDYLDTLYHQIDRENANIMKEMFAAKDGPKEVVDYFVKKIEKNVEKMELIKAAIAELKKPKIM